MKQRLSIVALAVVLLASACVRDGDFDELRHPMAFHGEFDPTYGFPVAWADADLGTLMGFVPSGAKFKILADPETGLLTLEKDSLLHNCYTFDEYKAGKGKGSLTKDGKQVVYRKGINHGNKIGLEELKKHDMVIKRLDLQMTAYVKAEVSGSTSELLASDAELFLDTLHMTIDFEDGTTYSTDLYWDAHATPEELLEGKLIAMPDPYDASYWVNSEAKRVHFRTSVNVAASGDNLTPSYLKDSLHIDSLIVDCHALVDFPAILYVGNLHETDTIAADMSKLDSILKDPSAGNDTISVSLNDTAENWLYIQADNGLPANLILQLRGLDSNYNDVTGNLLPDQAMDSNQLIYASGVTIVPEELSTGLYEGYMSNGERRHSEIRIKVTTDIVRQLAKSKYLELSLRATTPVALPPVGTELKPFVIFRDVDRMKLKVSLRVSPHLHRNIPVGPILK
ncbi:MAG: hypothetical protein J6W95_02030 [Bacteroidales bacterium]|nr:hypothetical protein [Bacteroidales bacterium]